MPKIELALVEEIPAGGTGRLVVAQRAEDCKLAGMALPVADYDFGRLATLGLDTVVSLIGRQDYDPTPLELRTFELHDLAGGLLPPDRVREEEEGRGRRVGGVRAARPGPRRRRAPPCGRRPDRHRDRLRPAARGHRPQDIVPWLDSVQRARGAHGWPESDWQRGQIDRFTRPGG